MENQKVELFFSSNGEMFPANQLLSLKNRLLNAPDERYSIINSIKFKNPTLILVLSILFGGLGVDRFMLGQTGLGIGKLLTCGGCGIWTIIDWFKVRDLAKAVNAQKLMNAC